MKRGIILASEVTSTHSCGGIFRCRFDLTDRLVEISTSKLPSKTLVAQTDRTLLLGAGSFRGTYPCDVTQQLSEFKPDYVLLHGSVHYERDVQGLLEELARVCLASSRIILVYYSTLWKPLLRLATALRLRRKTPEENWIANEDIWNLLLLAGYELLRHESKLLMPIYIPLVSYLVNRFLAPLPGFSPF